MAVGLVILLAEDREDDVLVIRKSLSQAFIEHRLIVVADGEEAIAYLNTARQMGDVSRHTMPDLFLLDLKMPRKDGFEVLEWVGKQPDLKGLPVIVLTSSESLRDMKTAYQLGACSFLVKPVDYREIRQLSRFLPARLLLPEKPKKSGRIASRIPMDTESEGSHPPHGSVEL